MKSIPPLRLVLALVGFTLFAVALVFIQQAQHGLVVQQVWFDGLPITIYTPATGDAVEHPLVLVGHGFSGSEVVMRGFSYTFAHAGYTVAAWDFDGHGGSTRRLNTNDLLQVPEAVVNVLAERGFTERQRIAILGHSMGSGVALEYGVEHPFAAATIAVSPVPRPVTPDLPRNLLLMAGTLEPRFLLTADQLLAQSGGPREGMAEGRARAVVAVPNVEHMSILFAPAAHQAALHWLDQTFGVQPGARPYTDYRLWWYLLGVLGAVLCAANLAPEAVPTANRSARPSKTHLSPGLPNAASPTPTAAPSNPVVTLIHPPAWRLALGMALGCLAATLVLWLVSRSGVRLPGLLGLSVGGYLLIWFGLAGVLAGVLGGVHWNRPRRRDVRGALIVFIALWVGFGWLGGHVWLHWGLVANRLLLWPLGLLLMLPWLFTSGEAMSRTGWVGRLAWWLAQSVMLALVLLFAMRLNPELGFLIIILPLFPVVLFIHMLAAAPQSSRWAYALSGAALLSWLLLAVFPLV